MNLLALLSKPGIDTGVVEKLSTVLSTVGGKRPNKKTMRKRALAVLGELEKTQGLEPAVRTMLLMTGADTFMPPQYGRFQKVVFEGAVFFISNLPRARIADKMVSQLVLPQDTPAGKRMCDLVTNLPTLQKLCQIICRSPGLDPGFKSALIDLEDNSTSVTYRTLRATIEKELNSSGQDLTLSRKILAEASVCAVVPGVLNEKKGEEAIPLVMKMVKPAIKRNMAGELALWGRLGDYLDDNKELWGLGNFQFRGIIDQVSRLLQNEVDLSLEQLNLDRAGACFAGDDTVIIPEPLEASTPNMTVMTRVDGKKITDVAHLTGKEQRRIARKVTEACILRPIVDLSKESLFHGDPHAGNMAYRFDGRSPELIFYDWGMVGRLSRLERFSVMLMIAGLAMKNEKAVYWAVDIMSGGQVTKGRVPKKKVKSIIAVSIASREKRLKGVLSSVEGLIEELMYLGVVFSSGLLVFEKSLVTLKGVLADIDPEFSRDEYVVWNAVLQLAGDFAHMRIQKMIISELWGLYRHSMGVLFDIQRSILRFGLELVNVRRLRKRYTD
ncbi:MAG: AarF/ABC1/UbiB kinase family protein [Desulfobacterales bacterium]|nr:AarF/ABC1/UbiB kinase family protein [Desulfobacterales bacterium]